MSAMVQQCHTVFRIDKFCTVNAMMFSFLIECYSKLYIAVFFQGVFPLAEERNQAWTLCCFFCFVFFPKPPLPSMIQLPQIFAIKKIKQGGKKKLQGRNSDYKGKPNSSPQANGHNNGCSQDWSLTRFKWEYIASVISEIFSVIEEKVVNSQSMKATL